MCRYQRWYSGATSTASPISTANPASIHSWRYSTSALPADQAPSALSAMHSATPE